MHIVRQGTDAVSVRCPEYGGVRFSEVSKVLFVR